jgi:hypothetical protein
MGVIVLAMIVAVIMIVVVVIVVDMVIMIVVIMIVIFMRVVVIIVVVIGMVVMRVRGIVVCVGVGREIAFIHSGRSSVQQIIVSIQLYLTKGGGRKTASIRPSSSVFRPANADRNPG